MAGDWIKMRTNLRRSPQVVRIASALNADRLRAVGALHAIWSLADEQTEDGVLDAYTFDLLDEEIAWPGFCAAMAAVGWLEQTEKGVCFPDFTQHNGASAKRRAQEADRKKSARASASPSASDADKKRTREEKRREELQTPLIPPAGGTAVKETGKKITLTDFLQACRDAKEAPISGYRPVWEYAEQIKLPTPFLELAWDEFKGYYRTNPKGQRAKHVDWRLTFLNSIKQTRGSLWYIDNAGQYALTTRGQQAQRAQIALETTT